MARIPLYTHIGDVHG